MTRSVATGEDDAPNSGGADDFASHGADLDELWIAPKGGPWEPVHLAGRWFPDAFIGTIANLQRFVAGEDAGVLSLECLAGYADPGDSMMRTT